MVASSIAHGVGINAMPEFHDEIASHDGTLFSFVELDPEEYVPSHPVVGELLAGWAERFPIVLHSTSLSLCGDNDLPRDLLARVGHVASLTGARAYSDHLSVSWAGDIELDLYMSPVMNDEAVAWVRSRVRSVERWLGIPFALENVGMLMRPNHSTYTETEFLHRALRAADCGLQLNLDSVAISAATLGVDPLDYLRDFPWEHVVTVTIVPETCMNPVLRIRYGSDLDGLMFSMLDLALRRSPARRVVVQRRNGNSLASLQTHFEQAGALYRRHRP
jgi:uncharacterized protein (UPF0276 family)